MAGVHDGHRERIRNRIAKYGFESLEDHEKLEYLLYSFIPRRDTNPIAHELIYTFGSYKKVLDADVEQLASVKGMTENAALFLHLLPDVFSAYLTADKEKALPTPSACAEVVIARIGRKREEHSLVLYLDENCAVIKSELSTGGKKAVAINREKVVSAAVQCRATYVVIGHNHPNGNLSPSDADIDVTNRIAQALGMVSVKLADHLIVSADGYHSMREHGEIVEAVDLSRPISQFAESLLRRESEISRLKRPNGN